LLEKISLDFPAHEVCEPLNNMSSEMSGEPYCMLTVHMYKLRVIMRNCVSYSCDVQTQRFVRTMWNNGLV